MDRPLGSAVGPARLSGGRQVLPGSAPEGEHGPMSDRVTISIDAGVADVRLNRPDKMNAFDGGMFVVSPPVGLVGLADRFERPVGPLEAPCKHTFQRHVAERLAAYGEPPAATMWALARSEFSRGGFAAAYGSFERAYAALMRFIDWSRDDWAVGAARACTGSSSILLT